MAVASASGDALSNPLTGTDGRCARRASGHKAAEPATRLCDSRNDCDRYAAALRLRAAIFTASMISG
jgi:hypothetical protein